MPSSINGHLERSERSPQLSFLGGVGGGHSALPLKEGTPHCVRGDKGNRGDPSQDRLGVTAG